MTREFERAAPIHGGFAHLAVDLSVRNSVGEGRTGTAICDGNSVNDQEQLDWWSHDGPKLRDMKVCRRCTAIRDEQTP